MTLVVRKENLPATIDELREFVIVTKKRIEAHKAQINAIERLGLSKSVYERKLKETQYMSETVLYAEAKMGALLKDLPPKRGRKKMVPLVGPLKQKYRKQVLKKMIECEQKYLLIMRML